MAVDVHGSACARGSPQGGISEVPGTARTGRSVRNTRHRVSGPRLPAGPRDRPNPLETNGRGLGCSPGVVRGRVRIVTDPNDGGPERALDTGCRAHTDPGWIMLFPSALAVLVERGSLLSHAAIVARELGIPAIVSVPGITRWLHDGDWVEMDGATGIIRRIDPGAAAARPRAVRSAVARATDFSGIRYAQVWEDADVLLAGLEVQPGDVCVSIASAGDNALALLTSASVARDRPGFERRTACLPRGARRGVPRPHPPRAAGARGLASVHPARASCIARCRTVLGPAARAFWDSRPMEIENGIGSSGKFERYLALFRRRVLPLVHDRETVEGAASAGDRPRAPPLLRRRVGHVGAGG